MSARAYKAYPAYKDSGVEWLGNIPAGWEVKRLKEVATIEMSNVDKKSVEGEVPVELCNYTDVYYHDRIVPDMTFMKATAPRAQVRRFALRAGDVLITKDSESWTDIAVPAVVVEDLPNVLCGYHLAHIRPHPAVYGPYLARAIGAVGPRDQFRVSANGVTRFAIGTDAIATSVFAIPAVTEQRAIATFLDRETARIDALVEKKERLITLLQERRTALITRAVTKGLDPAAPMKDSGVEWLGEIPEHWEVRAFRYCCRVTEGQVPPDAERFRDHVLIAPNHVESGTGRVLFTETAHEQGAISGKYRVDPGDVIYSKIRPALNKLCVAQGAWLCSADMYPIKTTTSELTTKYLLYFMLSDPFVRLMRDESMRVAMPKVNRETLAACPLLLPPVSEQHAIADAIVEKTGRIDSLIHHIRAAITGLHELRTAIISAAVTGRIDVRESAQ